MQMDKCLAIVLAGGRGKRLGLLTNLQPKPLIPFGGKYHLIDFTLSNCIHAKIPHVGIIGQYLKESLNNYLEIYQTNKSTKECKFQFLPSIGIQYNGTADSIFWNMNYINANQPEHVLILSSDHIYKMDYTKAYEQHVRSGADATIVTTQVSHEDTSRYGIVETGKNGKVISFEEKPKNSNSNTASMGIYFFKWSSLKHCLERDHFDQFSEHDFGENILPRMVYDRKNYKVFSYSYTGYWRDVGTIDSYWQANMDLLYDKEAFEMFYKGDEIHTGFDQSGKVILRNSGSIENSITTGCSYISGKVSNSIISNCCSIGAGTQIIDSVIMPYVQIGSNVTIKRAVVSQGTYIDNHVIVDHYEQQTSPLTYQNNCQYTENNIAVLNGELRPNRHSFDILDIPAFIWNTR